MVYSSITTSHILMFWSKKVRRYDGLFYYVRYIVLNNKKNAAGESSAASFFIEQELK